MDGKRFGIRVTIAMSSALRTDADGSYALSIGAGVSSFVFVATV